MDSIPEALRGGQFVKYNLQVSTFLFYWGIVSEVALLLLFRSIGGVEHAERMERLS